MRTVGEARNTAKVVSSICITDLSDMFDRRVSPQGLTLLAALKMTFWKDARTGRSFCLSTPELAREGFLPGWNRDRYWRALRDLVRTGELVKVTSAQPRDRGRFSACQYRFGDTPNYVSQDHPDSIWHDANFRRDATHHSLRS